jgi:hypothetical protein
MLLTELPDPGEIPMLAAGLLRDDTGSVRRMPRGSYSLRELAADSDAVVVFDERIAGEIDDSIPALWEEIPSGETAFIALVPRMAAPQIDSCYCTPISSFLCSSEVFARFLDPGIDCVARTLCFALLRAIADGAVEVNRLLVRQIPFLHRPVYGRETVAKALVLPHRGDPAFLRAALKYIGKSAGVPPAIRVGLDVGDNAEHGAFPDEYPGVEFFDFSPAPVGPYVIRQELAERSPESLLALQDSDDLSCYDRFAALGDALAETGCGIVGSQELCLDEIRSLVQPVRYPLDCSASLALRANHALLHATLMAHRGAFFKAGGLSTDLIIASDTQFLLRAFFNTTIRNVDEFLYIRRRHSRSLTNAPETVVDNPLRRRLGWEWTEHFDAIKRGELKMESSTLRPMRRTDAWKVERLWPARKRFDELLPGPEGRE